MKDVNRRDFLMNAGICLAGSLFCPTAVIAGASAIILSQIFPGNLYIVLAAVLAAILGVVLLKRFKWVWGNV